MIIELSQFLFCNYNIPSFSLDSGKMVRLWVDSPLNHEEKKFDVKHFKKILTGNKKSEKVKISQKLKISKYQTKNKFLNFFNKRTVYQYLKENYQLENDVINKKLEFFNIQPHFKLENLGLTHQKVFSIICEFQKSQNIIFDYYGLSENTEIQLTEYVKTELNNNNSAIGFNNLKFKSDTEKHEEIKDILILKIEDKVRKEDSTLDSDLLNKPNLKAGQFIVGQALLSTGHVLKPNHTMYYGHGDVYLIFNSKNEGLDFIEKTIRNNPKIECWMEDSSGKHIITIDKNGIRKYK